VKMPYCLVLGRALVRQVCNAWYTVKDSIVNHMIPFCTRIFTGNALLNLMVTVTKLFCPH